MPVLPSAQTIDLLRQIPLFQGLAEGELIALANHCRVNHYESEAVIFYQGDDCERVWILRLGRVKIIHHEEDGREVILEIIPPGEVFGGATIFLPEQPATARTITNAETVSFSAQSYMQFLHEHPAVTLKLIRMLGNRLHSLMEMQVLAGERVERRLAHILLKLAERVGRRQSEGMLITLPLSRQDLADLSGTTLETAIRIMSRLRTQGVVKTLRGGYLLILDEGELHRLAKP
jgi:CRP/FNR family transcriptional regulator